MAEVRDVLNAAADRIEPEGAWSIGRVALDSNGTPVPASSPRAVCWCALGAIWVEAGEERYTLGNAADEVFEATHGVCVAIFNDDMGKTQAEVVAALRSAAQSAGAEG